jgi:hypothetical protein
MKACTPVTPAPCSPAVSGKSSMNKTLQARFDYAARVTQLLDCTDQRTLDRHMLHIYLFARRWVALEVVDAKLEQYEGCWPPVSGPKSVG